MTTALPFTKVKKAGSKCGLILLTFSRKLTPKRLTNECRQGRNSKFWLDWFQWQYTAPAQLRGEEEQTSWIPLKMHHSTCYSKFCKHRHTYANRQETCVFEFEFSDNFRQTQRQTPQIVKIFGFTLLLGFYEFGEKSVDKQRMKAFPTKPWGLMALWVPRAAIRRRACLTANTSKLDRVFVDM